MISDRPPVRVRPTMPTASCDRTPYTIAHRKKNAVQISKIRDSTFIALPLPFRSAAGSLRRRALVAVGVERIGGDGLRRAQLTAVQRGQRLARGVRYAGDRVVLGTQLQVSAVEVGSQRPDLEVHRGVVAAAQLGAPADERTLPLDPVDDEHVVRVVLLRVREDV